MINQNLHRQPVALDSAQHRNLKLRLPITDWAVGRPPGALRWVKSAKTKVRPSSSAALAATGRSWVA